MNANERRSDGRWKTIDGRWASVPVSYLQSSISQRPLWRRPQVWLVLTGLFACLQYRCPFPAAVLSVVLCRIVWQREKENESKMEEGR